MNINDALTALTAATNPVRAARASTVAVTGLKLATFDGTIVEASAFTGENGKYATRISFMPRRTVNCTCPDATQRKVPCKHTAALANAVAALVS